MTPQTMPKRASVRQPSGPLSPRPRAAGRSPGTRTSSRTSSLVTDARSEILWCTSCAVKPGMPFSTRKPRTPSSVRAHTTATSAIEPLVIHILVPVKHPVRRRRARARVRIEPGSEPESGSVRPKQPISSPLAMLGQPPLLLLLAAVGVDRVHRQRALHADQRAQPGVDRLDLGADQPVLRGVAPWQP